METLNYQANLDTNQAVSNAEELANKIEEIGDAGEEAGDKVAEGMDTAKGGMDKAGKGVKGIGEQLGQLDGPIGSAIKGVQGVIKVFNILIMNPIGLIIAAIATALITLYKAFTSTKAGAEQMEQIMAGLSAVLDVLRDRVLKVTDALMKFFTADFSGAADSLTEAFSGLGDEISREFTEAAKLKKELQAIDDATRDLSKSRAEQNKVIAEAKLRINDENLSIDQRKKALEEVRQAEIKLAKQEEDLARRRYEAIVAQNALSDSSKEALEAEAQAYVELQNKQLESLNKQKELFDQEKALLDKIKSERAAAAAAYKANLEAVAKVQNDIRIALIEDERVAEKEKLKLQLEAQIKEINSLKINKAERAKLIADAREVERRAEVEVDDKYDKQEADKAKADKDKKEADAKTAHDKELADFQKTLNDKYAIQAQQAAQEVQSAEELAARLKEIEDAKNAELLAGLKARGEDTIQLENQIAQKTATDRFAAEKKALEDQKKLDAEALQAKQDMAKAISGALTAIAGAVGENTQFAKAAAVASAIIDTYAGATAALAAGAGTPIGYINAAAIVATGLANVRKILSTEVPGDKGGTSANVSMPSIGPSVEIAGQTVNSNTQVARQLGSALSRPPKAYVVGQDVSTQQSLDRKITQNATLGE